MNQISEDLKKEIRGFVEAIDTEYSDQVFIGKNTTKKDAIDLFKKILVSCDQYTIFDVSRAECNLEPLACIYCGSKEVVYDQMNGDALCETCGKWQLEDLNTETDS